MGAFNRANVAIATNAALEEIAHSSQRELYAAEAAVTPEQKQYADISVAIAKLNASIDSLRRQMQPRLWSAKVGFPSAATSPQLVLDLPSSLVWYEIFHASLAPSGNVYFYDHDGADLVFEKAIAATFVGPQDGPSVGRLFRKNISVQTDAIAPFPLYVVIQGIAI